MANEMDNLVTLGGLNQVYNNLDSKIKSIGTIYNVKGSVENWAALMDLTSARNGDIYNVIYGDDPRKTPSSNYTCIKDFDNKITANNWNQYWQYVGSSFEFANDTTAGLIKTYSSAGDTPNSGSLNSVNRGLYAAEDSHKGYVTIPMAGSATYGLVSTGSQSFAGDKTFTDAVTIEKTATLNQGLTVSGNVTANGSASAEAMTVAGTLMVAAGSGDASVGKLSVTNTLDVTDSATATSFSTPKLSVTGTEGATVNSLSGSDATMTVASAGCANILNVSGTLTATNGSVGTLAASDKTVTVGSVGCAGTLNVSGTLTAGTGSVGTLAASGKTVTVGSAGSVSTLNVSGTLTTETGSFGSLNTSKTITVGSAGSANILNVSGTLAAVNGSVGTLAASGKTVTVGSAGSANTLNVSGTLEATNGCVGTLAASGKEITVGSTGCANTLEVSGTLTAETGSVGNLAAGSQTVTVTGSASVEDISAGAVYVGTAIIGSLSASDKTMSVSGSISAENVESSDLLKATSIDVGSISASGKTMDVSGSISANNVGSTDKKPNIIADTVAVGSVSASGKTMNVSGTMYVNNVGSLGSNGTVANAPNLTADTINIGTIDSGSATMYVGTAAASSGVTLSGSAGDVRAKSLTLYNVGSNSVNITGGATIIKIADTEQYQDINLVHASAEIYVNSDPDQISTDDKLIKKSELTSAIQALDAGSVGSVGQYISAISETDGIISASATSFISDIAAATDNNLSYAPTTDAVKTYISNQAFAKTTASNSFGYKQTITAGNNVDSSTEFGNAALNVKGGIISESGIKANKIYNSVWNDLTDAIEVPEDVKLEYGYCYCFDGLKYTKTYKYAQNGILGIHSDTAGFELGHKGRTSELNVSVAGFVLAYLDKEYPAGTPLTSTKSGKLTKANLLTRIMHPERIVGIFWKKEDAEVWGAKGSEVQVNGRMWIKVK